MIELHQFPSAWKLNPSPFCVKVDTYLTLAQLPFSKVKNTPAQAPKGKLPFIVDGAQRVADSSQIIDYLKATYGDALDAALTPRQRSLGHLMRRVGEESLYFVLAYSRWLDDENWPRIEPHFFGRLPPHTRSVLPAIARDDMRETLDKQGYGRHSRDEIYAIGEEDLTALAEQLGGSGFAVAERPSSYDCSLYAVLANLLYQPVPTRLTAAVQARAPIVAYIERMDQAITAARA